MEQIHYKYPDCERAVDVTYYHLGVCFDSNIFSVFNSTHIQANDCNSPFPFSVFINVSGESSSFLIILIPYYSKLTCLENEGVSTIVYYNTSDCTGPPSPITCNNYTHGCSGRTSLGCFNGSIYFGVIFLSVSDN